MNIRFVSSLSPEEEVRLVQGAVAALAAILDQMPITYTLKIEVRGGRVFDHSHAPSDSEQTKVYLQEA